MLAASPLVAFIATENRENAKAFYRDILALPIIHEDHFACVFRSGANMLRLTTVEKRSPAPYTVLGWETTDIYALATQLASSGVRFEIFPGLGQDASGIWTSPDGSNVAWFKDPDGNILSISQHPAVG